jgi:hypothetical protein
MTGRYVVALGGTATLGKAGATPYPALVQGVAGCPVVNLGALNAGPDYYLAEPQLLQLAAGAQLALVQPGGAEGVTNPFYTVHSRRNDRFLGATPALRHLFPAVDFTDIHFTRHLLAVLHRTDPDRFAHVAQTLRHTWVARLRALLHHLPPRRIVLHLTGPALAEAGLYPPLVDPALMALLCGPGTALVEVALSDPAGLPGPQDHARIAACLAPELHRLIPGTPPLILRQTDRVG